MSVLEKVLGIASVGSTLASVSFLRRFLLGVTVVLALVAISGTMAGMLLIAGFYAAYLGLVRYGLQPQAAVITMSGIALAITATLAGLAVLRWRQLGETPQLVEESPVVGQLGKMANAFVIGLLDDHSDHHER